MDRFLTETTHGVNASFMVSSIESLLSPIASQCFSLSKQHIKLLFRLGYEVQSETLQEILQIWFQHTNDSTNYLVEILLSSDSLWKSKVFTTFEASIISIVGSRLDELQHLLGAKFSTCNTDMASLESVVLFAQKLPDQYRSSPSQQKSLWSSIQKYLSRCLPVLERKIIEHEHSEQLWSVLPDFLKLSEDVDLEKWLGLICTHDQESLIPEGIQSIHAIINRDSEVFHRELSGWITRTLSRFTRRFAEDETLADTTLKAVRAFGILFVISC